MTLRVPSCAACRVRAIGASAHDAPLACSCLAKSRVWLTDEVPRSTTTWPARMFFKMPSASNTARTCLALGRQRNTRSLCESTSAMDAATSAPSPRSRVRGSGARSKAITRLPLLFTRLRQIGLPITPRPMKPTVLYSDIASPNLFHKRTRRRQMQRKRIDLVAGARIDFSHDRIMAGNEAIGMAGEPLDNRPALRHVTNIVDDRKRAAFLQVRIVMRGVRGEHHGAPRGLDP